MESRDYREVFPLVMGVQEDLKDLGEKLSKLKEDPEQFRFALAGAILVVGMLLVKMPLSSRIEAKKIELAAAEELADRAERVMKLRKSASLFEDRLSQPSQPSDWQKYLYEVVEKSGVAMPRQDKSASVGIYDFQQVTFPIDVSGTYAQIWTFIDTIERGSRLMRFENLQLTLGEDGTLTLKCELIGISRNARGGGMGEGSGSMEGEGPPPDWSEEEDIA